MPAFVGVLEPWMWGVAGWAEKMGGTCERAHLDMLLGTFRCVIWKGCGGKSSRWRLVALSAAP